MSNNYLHDHENHYHAHSNPFALAFFIILIFAAIEFFGGVYTNSLALMGDAGHMLSDAAALGLAWFASHRSTRNNVKKYANGLTQIELLASIINCVLMLGITLYIVVEAIARLKHPVAVTGFYVICLALLGVVVNVLVAKILHHHGTEHGAIDNLNHRAAFLHVLGDLLASVAALAAGTVIYFTGWYRADPILSLLISALILGVTLNLAKDVVHTLQGKSLKDKAAKPHGHSH